MIASPTLYRYITVVGLNECALTHKLDFTSSVDIKLNELIQLF